jgi:hypothetical protein
MNCIQVVEFEVLTLMVMTLSIFWDMTHSSALKVKWTFRKNTLHSFIELKNKPRYTFYLLHACFWLDLLLDPQNMRKIFLPKRRLTLSGLKGVIFHKIELFIFTLIKVK